LACLRAVLPSRVFLAIAIVVTAATVARAQGAPSGSALLAETDTACVLTVDGKDIGPLNAFSPKKVSVTPGEHTVKAVSSAGAVWEQTIRVVDGEKKPVLIVFASSSSAPAQEAPSTGATSGTAAVRGRRAKASLRITAPEACEISVDGQKVGRVEADKERVVPMATVGSHLVDAVALSDGGKWSQIVEVALAEDLAVEVDPGGKKAAIAKYKEGCYGKTPNDCGSLGLAYRDGKGVAANAAVAVGFFKKGCEGGSAWSCGLAGEAHEYGRGVEKDVRAAFQLFEKACGKNGWNYWACGQFGRLHEEGKGTPKNASAAYAAYSKGCAGKAWAAGQDGNAWSCLQMARCLQKGIGVGAADAKAALPIYTNLCATEASACDALGDLYEKGAPGVKKDAASAVRYWNQACDRGGTWACVNLGRLYQTGSKDLGVRPDLASTARYYQRACDAGWAEQCVILARMHLRGEGIARDVQKAVTILHERCDKQHGSSCRILGELYAKGEEVSRDAQKSATLLDRACSGSRFECANVGGFYEKQSPPDLALAEGFFKRACGEGEKASTKGCRALGAFYERRSQGTEAKTAYEQGLLVAKKECESDRSTPFSNWDIGCINAGSMYALGQGTARDTAKARALYKDVCAAGMLHGCNSFAYQAAEDEADLEEALRTIGTVLAREPDEASYLDTHGWVLFKMKRYDKAEKALRMALEKAPESPMLLEHLGDCLSARGKAGEAVELWKKAIAKRSDEDVARVKRKIAEAEGVAKR
jgi:TPR repeat protein